MEIRDKVVYRHLRPNGETFYIGIGYYKRAYDKSNRNNHWNNIVNKYNYTIEILQEDLTWEEAVDQEIMLIALYGREDLDKGLLCNMTDGGEGVQGYIMSNEQKAYIGNLASKRIGKLNPFYGKHHTEELKRFFSESQKGEKGPNYGKDFSIETRKKMSDNNRRGKHPQSRSVINIETGQIWDCMKDCSEEMNLSYSKIKYWVKVNNKLIRYVTDTE